MNRRSMVQALGAAVGAPILSSLDPYALIAAEVRDPVYVLAFTEGPRGERYRHSMPADMRYVDGPEPWRTSLVVEFISPFTGDVRSASLWRGDVELCRLSSDIFTTHWVSGGLVRFKFATDSNPSEDA